MHKKRRETASRPAEMFGRHEACVRLPVRRGRGRRAAGAGTRLPVPDAARALAAPSTARLSGLSKSLRSPVVLPPGKQAATPHRREGPAEGTAAGFGY